ncbi:UNVERIFIED_CONTAM: hypothetical protein FKN15_041840 [Acipenser sinensis]
MQITQHEEIMSCNHDNDGRNERRLCIGVFSGRTYSPERPQLRRSRQRPQATAAADPWEATAAADPQEATAAADPQEATAAADPQEATAAADPQEATAAADPQEVTAAADPQEATAAVDRREATLGGEPLAKKAATGAAGNPLMVVEEEVAGNLRAVVGAASSLLLPLKMAAMAPLPLRTGASPSPPLPGGWGS